VSLTDRCYRRLEGVHPDLVEIVLLTAERGATFIVTEGERTMKRQQELFAAGATRTMKSRHIATNNECGMACAVDLAVLVGKEVRWDWPLYRGLADDMFNAAATLGTPLEWGGDWRSFKDGPHFQLPWKDYP
jgi:peptidoglycan L-alanyl-D-glutamate endopeptidase CwlK